MNKLQAVSGTIFLGAILLFGLQGVIQHVQAGEFRYVPNQIYIEECGACHLAYPPQLLPEQSWQQVMAGLEDHFGENAEVDPATETQITTYLYNNALGTGKPSAMSQLMRNMPDEPPLRITELPAFIDAHTVIKKQLEIDEFSEGFLSPCADCHRQAASALFDKELLHPGYGPSNWGGSTNAED